MANGAAAAANTTTKVRKRKESQFSLVMKRLSKNRLAMAGLVIILILFLLAIFSPWIMPYPYEEMNMAERFASPSLKHLCGTDEMGRDIFSRLLYGARASLSLGFLATIISTVIGMIIGSIVGYFGGAVDTVVMRLVDILQAIPGILLAIAISACLGRGFTNTIIAFHRRYPDDGASAARLHYGCAQDGIPGGGADDQLLGSAYHYETYPAEQYLPDHCIRYDGHRKYDPDGSVTQLHWTWRTAADAGVGRNALRSENLHERLSAHGIISRSCDRAGGAVSEYARRRSARCAGSEAEEIGGQRNG